MAYIKRNTAPHSILRHLFYVPVANQKDMQFLVSRDEKTRGTVASAVKKLLEKELMEPVTQMEGHYRITPTGVAAICALEPELARDRNYITKVSTVYCRKHEYDFSVRALCAGTGIRTYPCDKPEFASLAAMLNPSLERSRFSPAAKAEKKGLTSATETEFTYQETPGTEALLKDGVYYSSVEVRKGIKRTGLGLEDVANGTRMTGLVIRGRKLYLIYTRISDTVIWKDEWENGLVDALQGTMFRDFFVGKPAGVFMSKSYSLAPTLALGCRYGRMKAEKARAGAVLEAADGLEGLERERFLASKEYEQEKQKKFREDKKRHSIYLNTASRTINEILCVPLKPAFAVDMYWSLSTDRDRHINGGKLWFGRHEGFQVLDTGSLFTGMSLRDGCDAAYIAVMDCRLLYDIRETGKRTAVVTRPELAPHISHILGPMAVAFYDMETGEMIKGVREYDEYGYPSDEKPRTIKKIPKQKEQLSDLRTWVGKETKDYYDMLSAEKGISLSKLISMALERCIDDPDYLSMAEQYRVSHTGRNAKKGINK